MKTKFIFSMALVSALSLTSCYEEPTPTPYVPPTPMYTADYQTYVSSMSRAADTYVYTGNYTASDWHTLQTTEINVLAAAAQVPDAVLESMSTEGLIYTLVSNPLVWNVFNFNGSNAIWFTMVKSYLGNVYAELTDREDLTETMLSVYRGFTASGDGGKMAHYVLQMLAVQTQVDLAAAMNADELHATMAGRGELAGLILSKSETVVPEFEKLTAYLVGRLMRADGYEPLTALYNEEPLLDSFLSSYKGSFSNYNKVISVASGYAR